MQPESMSPEEVRQSRNCAINQVLGTDMKKHFGIQSRFQVTAHALIMMIFTQRASQG